MNLCITTKHYQMNSLLWRVVSGYAEKLLQRLPHLNPNLGLIKLVMKRNKRRNYFEGSISFSVPKKHLQAYFQGFYAEEEIKNAFERLQKELSRYKGKHFAGNSQYFRHESIRRNFGY